MLGRAVRYEMERSLWLGEGPGQPWSLHLRYVRVCFFREKERRFFAGLLLRVCVFFDVTLANRSLRPCWRRVVPSFVWEHSSPLPSCGCSSFSCDNLEKDGALAVAEVRPTTGLTPWLNTAPH